MRNEKSKIFDSLLDTFENDDIKNFANECIETIPNYFWDVGASARVNIIHSMHLVI